MLGAPSNHPHRASVLIVLLDFHADYCRETALISEEDFPAANQTVKHQVVAMPWRKLTHGLLGLSESCLFQMLLLAPDFLSFLLLSGPWLAALLSPVFHRFSFTALCHIRT